MDDLIAGDIGGRLRRARKQRGLSLLDAAGRTKLSIRVLQAIERNDFESLPGGIYRKGYLRSLAGEVGLDPKEIAADYHKAFEPITDPAATATGNVVRGHPWVRHLTPSSRRSFVTLVILIALVLGWFVWSDPIEAAQDGASATATRNLIRALDEAGLEAIAAIDPTELGTFVAALHIKGGQLLVVRARHPSVEALSARLAARQFRDVYLDLQATPNPAGKVFVMDSGADGLPSDAEPPSNVDVVYEDGTRQVIFNGARAQKLGAGDYRQQLQDADAKYTRLLDVLIAALRRPLSAVEQ